MSSLNLSWIYFSQQLPELTLDSGGHCQALLDYFVDRLDKKSYHVKLKVLRIMKYIVENGHPDFRQGLRRQSRGIKMATSTLNYRSKRIY